MKNNKYIQNFEGFFSRTNKDGSVTITWRDFEDKIVSDKGVDYANTHSSDVGLINKTNPNVKDGKQRDHSVDVRTKKGHSAASHSDYMQTFSPSKKDIKLRRKYASVLKDGPTTPGHPGRYPGLEDYPLYSLYSFNMRSRAELISMGFYVEAESVDKFEDPLYIFLNCVKGHEKYRGGISNKEQLDKVITNEFMNSLMNESVNLSKEWWYNGISSKEPAIIIPVASGVAQYPSKYKGKSLNEHLVEALNAGFGVDPTDVAVSKRSLSHPDVTYDATPITDSDYEYPKSFRVSPDKNKEVYNWQKGDPVEWKGKTYRELKVKANALKDEKGIEKTNPNILSLQRRIQKAKDSGAADVLKIKDIKHINRWRIGNLFDIAITEKTIQNIIKSNKKILLVDDNLDSGATMFGIVNSFIKLGLPKERIVCVAQFEAKIFGAGTDTWKNKMFKLSKDKNAQQANRQTYIERDTPASERTNRGRHKYYADEEEDKYIYDIVSKEMSEYKDSGEKMAKYILNRANNMGMLIRMYKFATQIIKNPQQVMALTAMLMQNGIKIPNELLPEMLRQ